MNGDAFTIYNLAHVVRNSIMPDERMLVSHDHLFGAGKRIRHGRFMAISFHYAREYKALEMKMA